MKTDYEKQANEFAKNHGCKLTILNQEYRKYLDDDKEERCVFTLLLSRGEKQYQFTFGQSINSGAAEPTYYDIFTCFQKYEVGTFDDFCSEFGYNDRPLSDHDKVMKIYKAVKSEYTNLKRLFTEEEIELMREIQ